MRDVDKTKKLKRYFEGRDDVVMAFLFGSRAKKREMSGSDWDIAVYFKPEKNYIEWEEHDRNYPEEDCVWNDCIDILKTDNVDLLVLNRAPADVADEAINGIPIVIKDRDLWLNFMLIVTREAEDYRNFVDEYYAISQRSASLAPQDRKNLKKILSFIEEQTSLYSYFINLSKDEYEQNIHKRNDVERWIENIANAVIDISKIVLGSQKKAIPSTYRDAVRHAIYALSLPKSFVDRFEKWMKLRNILAHEYLDIKWERIYGFIQTSEDYLRSFIEATKKFLNKNA